MKQIDFFKLQKEILEKLFPPRWFLETSQKNHPAYLRWALCKKVLEQGGIIQFPEQKAELPEIGRVALDSLILVTLTEGDIQQLKFGLLDVYGDEAVSKKIRSRITNPEQFEDIMVELAFGAWHKTNGHGVTPLEIESFPDLKLEIPGADIPVFVECKNLRSSSKNRIIKEISKASSQIKATKTPCYGIALFNVSIPVAAGQVENDELPCRLQEMINIVQSAISGSKNRSVGVVILVWDDYMIMGEPPNKTQVAFRRRYVRIPHSPEENTQHVPEDLPLFEGYTTLYTIHWKPREQPIEEYVFAELFKRECQDRFYISQSDVIEAIEKRDKEDSLILDEQKEIMIFSRHISPMNRDFYMLVCAERKAQSLIIYWAFRIFTDLCQEIHLLSPIQLLARFASAYGLPITIGDLTSRFIFAHRVEVGSRDPLRLVAVHNPENHSFINCFLLKVSPKGEALFVADCALMFCIDITLYKNWMTTKDYVTQHN